jgi:hypothetical protein
MTPLAGSASVFASLSLSLSLSLSETENVRVCLQACTHRVAEHGAWQAWHYFIDPCDNYATANYSDYGLGCDRANVSGSGTAYTDQYLPPVAAMFRNASTCPHELLLFMHNRRWDDPMQLSNGSIVPLIDYIADSQARALATVQSFVDEWAALQPYMDVLPAYALACKHRATQSPSLTVFLWTSA